MKIRTELKLVTLLLILASFGACNHNNNAGGIPSPQAFVNKLVELAKNGTVPSGYANSDLAKAQAKVPGYFVIWDAEDQSYIAVNLSQYNTGTLDQAVGAFVQNDLANPATAGVLVTASGTDQNGNPLFTSANGTVYERNAQTKDVDLQRAQLQSDDLNQTAANISAHFQMSFQSAMQLATLADRVSAMSGGTTTEEDRKAITQSLAGIAGLTPEELNQGIVDGINGNQAGVNTLTDKAAKNLGMPSGATLREQMLKPMGLSD